MPYHRIPRWNAADSVAAIEEGGEELVSVQTEGDHYAVFTRKLGTITDDGTKVRFRPVEIVDFQPGRPVSPTR
jgi:hypothetical protein